MVKIKEDTNFFYKVLFVNSSENFDWRISENFCKLAETDPSNMCNSMLFNIQHMGRVNFINLYILPNISLLVRLTKIFLKKIT